MIQPCCANCESWTLTGWRRVGSRAACLGVCHLTHKGTGAHQLCPRFTFLRARPIAEPEVRCADWEAKRRARLLDPNVPLITNQKDSQP